jgi:hypothetical protein
VCFDARAAECTLYEQSHPAFLLSGSHLSTGKCATCASCHINSVFTGTPTSCVQCHNGDPSRLTVGRSAKHIPTALIECSYCHTTLSFTVATMNHIRNRHLMDWHNGENVAYPCTANSSPHRLLNGRVSSTTREQRDSIPDLGLKYWCLFILIEMINILY